MSSTEERLRHSAEAAPEKESVSVDRRSVEVEVRSSEPQASGAVGGEMLKTRSGDRKIGAAESSLVPKVTAAHRVRSGKKS